MTDGIVRRGDRVHRPMGPWSPAVHEYLRYLESAGFAGSPRVLGIEREREVLSHVDGDVPADPEWQPGHGHRLPAYARTDLALTRAAELLRRLHVAAAGFRPAITEYRFHPHPPRPGPAKSSRMAISARGTPFTATGYRSPSSTGTPPSPPTRWSS